MGMTNIDSAFCCKQNDDDWKISITGNTCYLNSVLQVLRYTPDFRSELSELAEVVKNTMRELRVQGDEPLLDVCTVCS